MSFITRTVSYPSRRLLPVQAGILLTFLLVPVWYRFKGVAGPFDALFSAGFLIFWPMLWTVGWWLVLGLPGFANLRRNPVRRLWALALLTLALWAFLSQAWAYTRSFQPEVTLGAALPFALAALFAVIVACAGPPARVIVTTLVIGLAWNTFLAGAQVAVQGSVGLIAPGEFALNPAASGTAVVQADGVRWLRPYGLLPHPNILGGFFALALLAALVSVLSGGKQRRWLVGTLIFLAGLWAFLLTFSRSAWLGFMAGALAILPLLWRLALRDRSVRRRFAVTLGLGVATAGLFAALYWPFLLARTGAGGESIELRSASDRAVFMEFAFRAICESPLLGLGIGNFPWRMTWYLQFTAYDLQGQPAHHVFLSAWAELGLVGFALLALALVFGVEAALKALTPAPSPSGRGGQFGKPSPPLQAGEAGRGSEEALARSVLLGGVVALAVIGLLDHYPWTLLHFQAAWWGLMAAAGKT
ncbi:MAG: O-antigen ligase family protein [Chloroflexi bacterium]|nr:O-antigen ligase family protein [Chloroflexota bacterium]